MSNEDRQQKINELKALRAELMAYKESQEGESSEGNANSVTLTSLRKAYMAENENESAQDTESYNSIKQETYTKYASDVSDTKTDSQENQKVLTRRK